MLIQEEQSPLTTPLPEAFHEFYDPNGRHGGNDETVLHWMLAQRRAAQERGEAVTVQTAQGEREITDARTQIAIELGHLSMLTRENVSDWAGLGLSEDKLIEAVDIAEFGVAQTVKSIKKAVSSLAREKTVQDRMREIHDEDGEDSVEMLLAGLVVAANAHKDQRRMNGVPFFTHPAAVAKILSLAIRDDRKWKKKHGVLGLRLLQYRALVHAAFEDRLPGHTSPELRGTSFLRGDNLLASPLMHKRLLESYLSPESKNEATNTAIDVYYLTKPIGPDGHITNDRYMNRLKVRSLAMLVKLADITHNLRIDPKEKPIDDKYKRKKWKLNRSEYRHNLRTLRLGMCLRGGTPLFQKRLSLRVPKVSGDRLVAFGDHRLLSHFTSNTLTEAYEQSDPGVA